MIELETMNKSNPWKSLENTFKDTDRPQRRRSLPKSNKLKSKLKPLRLEICRRPQAKVSSAFDSIASDSSDNEDTIIDAVPTIQKPSSSLEITSTPSNSKQNKEENVSSSRYIKTESTNRKSSWPNLREFNRRHITVAQKQLEDSIIESDSDDAIQASPPIAASSKLLTSAKRQLSEQIDIASDSSSTQHSAQDMAEYIIDTQSSGQSLSAYRVSEPSPVKGSPKRKRFKKGGLVEQLRTSINRAKSNHLYWMHEREAGLNRCGDFVRIDDIEHNYGKTVLRCTLPNGGQKIACLQPDLKSASSIKIGMSIEIDFDSTGHQLDDAVAYANVFKIKL